MAADSLPPDGPLRAAAMIDGLAGSVREAWVAFPQDAEARARQISALVGDIRASLTPLVSALEPRPGGATELERQMEQMDRTAMAINASIPNADRYLFGQLCGRFAADIRDKWQILAPHGENPAIGEPLSERAEEAAAFIREKGFACGKEIANYLGVEEATVRSHVSVHGFLSKSVFEVL